MSGLLIIQPVKKGKTIMAKRKHKRRLSAKQIAAGFGGKRGRRTGHKRPKRNPTATQRAVSRYIRKPHTRRFFSGLQRGRRRARAVGGMLEKYGLDTVFPASLGAVGALALDLGWSYVPLPATVLTGPLAPVVRLAGAVAIGMAATAVGGRKFGRDVTAGATVVTLYDSLKGFIKAQYPNFALQGLGRYNAAINIGRPGGMGMYVGRYGRRRPPLGMYVGEFTPDYVNEYTTDSFGIAYGSEPEPQM